MKFLSYVNAEGEHTWGAESDGTVVDLGDSGRGIAPNLRTAIADNALIDLEVDFEVDGVALTELILLPVIPDPAKILCIGVNYVSHQQETGKRADAPTVFNRYADSQMGHGEPAQYPSMSKQFDYEGELAIVISKDTYRVSQEQAWEHIAGAAPYNDFSVRDWQRAASQWLPGKTFVGTGGFGPSLVLTKDLPSLEDMQLTTKVNGEIRQDASLCDLDFDIPKLIEYVSTFTPLTAGDVIVTGTPGGVGLFREPPALLEDGDTVEVEVTGVGLLRNVVKKEDAQ